MSSRTKKLNVVLFVGLLASWLAGCTCSNGEGYCGKPPAGIAGNSPADAPIYFRLDPAFTCTIAETGQTIASYVDKIIYSDGKYYQAGTACAGTATELDGNAIETSSDGRYLGNGAGIYERRTTAPSLAATDTYTDAWCRSTSGPSVDTYVTSPVGGGSFEAFLAFLASASQTISATRAIAGDGTRTYQGTGFTLTIAPSETPAYPFERAAALDTSEQAGESVRCRVLP